MHNQIDPRNPPNDSPSMTQHQALTRLFVSSREIAELNIGASL
jgi:hypothetical protein